MLGPGRAVRVCVCACAACAHLNWRGGVENSSPLISLVKWDQAVWEMPASSRRKTTPAVQCWSTLHTTDARFQHTTWYVATCQVHSEFSTAEMHKKESFYSFCWIDIDFPLSSPSFFCALLALSHCDHLLGFSLWFTVAPAEEQLPVLFTDLLYSHVISSFQCFVACTCTSSEAGLPWSFSRRN